MSIMELKNKRIVVIGGAGLLGEELSRACAKAGAAVIIADINQKKGMTLAEEVSGSFEEVDIRDVNLVERACDHIAGNGKIDGVINALYPRSANFGKKFDDAEIADMLEDVRLHVGSCFSIAKFFGRKLREQKSGSIVFISSIYGFAAPRFEIYEDTDMTMPAEYAAAKGAILALTKYFAALLGKDGVRVNALSPGGIYNKQSSAFIAAYEKRLLISSGLLHPSDVSGAALFLLSDASSKMTGQNLIVDGGWTL